MCVVVCTAPQHNEGSMFVFKGVAGIATRVRPKSFQRRPESSRPAEASRTDRWFSDWDWLVKFTAIHSSFHVKTAVMFRNKLNVSTKGVLDSAT